MANLKLAEQFVDACVAKLKANMATRIAQINTEASAGTIATLSKPLVAPDNTNGYQPRSFQSIPESSLPLIMVTEGVADFQHEPGEVHSLIPGTEIKVYVLESDPSRDALRQRLSRQARAIIESLWDSTPKEKLNDASGAALAWKITPLRTTPGPVSEPTADDQYRGMYRVDFLVVNEES